MDFSKYKLTNTDTTITTFYNKRCDDSIREFQVELEKYKIKNIWLIDGTTKNDILSLMMFNSSIQQEIIV